MKSTRYLDLKKWGDKLVLTHSNCLIDGDFWRKFCYKLDLKRRVKWKITKKKSSNKLKDSKTGETIKPKEEQKEGGDEDNQEEGEGEGE